MRFRIFVKISIITSLTIVLFTIMGFTSIAFADPQASFQITGGQNPSMSFQAGNQPTVDWSGLFVIIVVIAVFGGAGGLGWIIVGSLNKSKKSKFVCGYCNYETEIEDNLYAHYERKHRKNSETQDTKDNMLPNDEKETPLDILKTRLAKGEISKEEYDELKKRLRR